MSHPSWTPIPATTVQPILGSGCTCELPKAERPPRAQNDPKFLRFCNYGLLAGATIPSVTTSLEHAARLVAERFDPKDAEPTLTTGTPSSTRPMATSINPAPIEC